MPTILLILGSGVLAAAGILLVFVVLSRTPAKEQAADASPGLRGQVDGAFQAVAERMSDSSTRRGKPPLSERLARAGMRVKPSEYTMIQVGCTLALALLAFVRFGVHPAVLVAGVVGMLIPGFYVKFRISRRLKHLNNQLVDVLSLMSNSLKAGHSLPQTLDLISHDARPPIAEEFARCVRELQVGVAGRGRPECQDDQERSDAGEDAPDQRDQHDRVAHQT